MGIGVGSTLIRLLSGHKTSFVFIVTILFFFIFIALSIGYIDYNFYEKSVHKLIAQLLDKEPLLNFQKIGFSKEDNKLEGTINNYKVILSPFKNIQSDKALIVLIPLKIREGLDNYFTKYNDAFKFNLSGEIIFAEAILKDYEKEFDSNKLLTLIEKTTFSLKENKIEPLDILGE